MPDNDSPVTVRIPAELRKDVDALAAASQRSRSFIIKEALHGYVQQRSAYLRDLNNAMESVERGEGHSFGQISRWIASWGKEGELPSPKPDIAPRR